MDRNAQARVIDAVRAAHGDRAVETDQERIAPWLTDWRGRFHGQTPAILQPGTLDETAAIVATCAAHGAPLVPQGGNTSMVGGATPPGDGSALLLSTRRLNRVRSIDVDRGVAVAEAGVILQVLHGAADEMGLRFPLTLGARGSATIGGLVSTNAGGTQVLRWGTMARLVLGVEAVLPDGSVIDALHPLTKDTRGYDVARLLVGGEGTLGVVTAAALRLVPAVGRRAVAWAGLNEPRTALSLLRAMQARFEGLESFEIIPGDTLARAVAYLDRRPPLEGSHRWHVLIEVVATAQHDDPVAAIECALADALERGWIDDATIAASEGQADAFWTLRDSLSAAERAGGAAVQHDIAVPVDRMPAFMVEAAEAAERRFPGTHATAFGHLGDGNVHFHVRAPAGVEPDRWYERDAPAITRFVHDAVVAAGGTIAAEHGIGQMKLDELSRLASPSLLSARQAIKRAIDPSGLFNPGKLVPLAPMPEPK